MLPCTARGAGAKSSAVSAKAGSAWAETAPRRLCGPGQRQALPRGVQRRAGLIRARSAATVNRLARLFSMMLPCNCHRPRPLNESFCHEAWSKRLQVKVSTCAQHNSKFAPFCCHTLPCIHTPPGRQAPRDGSEARCRPAAPISAAILGADLRVHESRRRRQARLRPHLCVQPLPGETAEAAPSPRLTAAARVAGGCPCTRGTGCTPRSCRRAEPT